MGYVTVRGKGFENGKPKRKPLNARGRKAFCMRKHDGVIETRRDQVQRQAQEKQRSFNNDEELDLTAKLLNASKEKRKETKKRMETRK